MPKAPETLPINPEHSCYLINNLGCQGRFQDIQAVIDYIVFMEEIAGGPYNTEEAALDFIIKRLYSPP